MLEAGVTAGEELPTTARMPSLFVIGAQRCATSTLYDYLSRHPEIFMSKLKEPRYFSHVDSRPAFAGPGDAGRVNAVAVTDIDRYRELFTAGEASQLLGEATTTYLTDPNACESLKACNLERPRFIALVRNPIERALSSYLYKKNQGLEPEPTFKEALDREAERIEANWSPIWHYANRGLYMPGLRRFISTFGQDSVRVLTYDAFTTETTRVLDGIRRFLELEQAFPASNAVHYNAAAKAGSRKKRTGFGRIVHSLRRRIGLAKTVAPKSSSARSLDQGTFSRLGAFFREDVSELQDLLKLDLSHWLRAG